MNRADFTKKYLIIFALILLLLCPCFGNIGCTKKEEDSAQQVFGVWWWNNRLDSDIYLDFAVDNGVNEVYYYDSSLSTTSSSFIDKAKSKNVKVYWLIGDVEYLRNRQELFDKLDQFVDYNNNNPSYAYDGIHLDIEPHQDDYFDIDRTMLIYNLIDIAYALKQNYPQIQFDYDLPFWLEDEIDYNGQIKPAYAHMIDIADRIFLMSYRDSAEAMLDISSEELEYAKNVNKPIILGAETAETSETESVSYFEEGKMFMQNELEKVKLALPKNCGISVHHILSWYELRD